MKCLNTRKHEIWSRIVYNINVLLIL